MVIIKEDNITYTITSIIFSEKSFYIIQNLSDLHVSPHTYVETCLGSFSNYLDFMSKNGFAEISAFLEKTFSSEKYKGVKTNAFWVVKLTVFYKI